MPLNLDFKALGQAFTAIVAVVLFLSRVTPVNAQDVNQSPLAVHVERAFPNVLIDRPVFLLNAGDGVDRIFVGNQKGFIYSLANDQAVEEPQLFMDISDRVTYKDEENEEGLLGLAFHPKFKENGEFFIYYTSKKEPHLSVLSRFKASGEDHSHGDPGSEQVLMTIKQPFWNHNGGSLAFGPDGFLYIGMGDGGKANDPLLTGQDLSTVLGKIMRIDIDHHDPGMPYAIPKDNPFKDTPNARPEIFALGLRNVWGMSFDPETKNFWVADVGQNLWEEINLVTRGGNYGWSKREGKHPFENRSTTKPEDCIDPVWEYPHEEGWGKSITGGYVYRGSLVPSLKGYYVYGDYVSGNLWALKYDQASGKVTENRKILWPPHLPVVTFGCDQNGELFFTTVTSGGRIYRFVEGEPEPTK